MSGIMVGKSLASGGALVALVVACVGGRPTTLPSTVRLPLGEVRFDNGMRVVVHDDASTNTVSIAMAVATGAGDDPKGREGLAHAVEHLAFRARHDGQVPMRLRFDRMGARFNAWTSSEATVYFASAPKAAFGELCRAFGDIAKSPVAGVPPEVLEVERGVLENERRVRDENGAPGAIIDRLRALVFGDSRLGQPIGGTSESIAAITLEDAKTFAATRYDPQTMTVVVAGPISDQHGALEPFGSLAKLPAGPANARPVRGTPAPDAIARVSASMLSPELWIGFPLPSGYGRDRARMNVVAQMASGAIASEAWGRHGDVTTAFCFLNTESGASMLVCRATLSSSEHADDVRASLLHVMRKGVADRAVSRDSRYIYQRSLATTELLELEALGSRTQELLLGVHFAKNPTFSLNQVGAMESLSSDDLMGFYDRTLTREASRAVLALPDSGQDSVALAAPPADPDIGSAAAADPTPLLAGLHPERIERRTLRNGLRVVTVQRPTARFQTALLGFLDGTAREPAAVAEATQSALRVFLVDPPRGVSEQRRWERDRLVRIVRGTAGDPAILLKRLMDGLSHFDFEWKSDWYLDFSAGEKKREQDPRVRTPMLFERDLLVGSRYGTPSFSADVDAITLPQIQDYYSAMHRPENAILVMVGPSSLQELSAAASSVFGDWQLRAKREPRVPAVDSIRVESREGLRLLVGDRPSDSQVQLAVGCLLPATSRESEPVEDVFTYVLDAQLDVALRQRTGATYGVQTAIERLRGGTTFLTVESSVASEHLDASLGTLKEWFTGAQQLLTPESVDVARFGVIRDHVLGAETSVALAYRLLDDEILGWSPGDRASYPKRVTAVDAAAVARLLERCRATSYFSAVGDERKIRGAWYGGR